MRNPEESASLVDALPNPIWFGERIAMFKMSVNDHLKASGSKILQTFSTPRAAKEWGVMSFETNYYYTTGDQQVWGPKDLTTILEEIPDELYFDLQLCEVGSQTWTPVDEVMTVIRTQLEAEQAKEDIVVSGLMTLLSGGLGCFALMALVGIVLVLLIFKLL